MRLDKLGVEHLVKLDQIHKEDFPLPDYLDNPLYVATPIVLDDSDCLVAAGFLKLTSEALVISDPKASRLSRAKAMKLLLHQMKYKVASLGLDGAHVFLQGPKTEETQKALSKRGFIVDGGTTMYYRR